MKKAACILLFCLCSLWSTAQSDTTLYSDREIRMLCDSAVFYRDSVFEFQRAAGKFEEALQHPQCSQQDSLALLPLLFDMRLYYLRDIKKATEAFVHIMHIVYRHRTQEVGNYSSYIESEISWPGMNDLLKFAGWHELYPILKEVLVKYYPDSPFERDLRLVFFASARYKLPKEYSFRYWFDEYDQLYQAYAVHEKENTEKCKSIAVDICKFCLDRGLLPEAKQYIKKIERFEHYETKPSPFFTSSYSYINEEFNNFEEYQSCFAGMYNQAYAVATGDFSGLVDYLATQIIIKNGKLTNCPHFYDPLTETSAFYKDSTNVKKVISLLEQLTKAAFNRGGGIDKYYIQGEYAIARVKSKYYQQPVQTFFNKDSIKQNCIHTLENSKDGYYSNTTYEVVANTIFGLQYRIDPSWLFEILFDIASNLGDPEKTAYAYHLQQGIKDTRDRQSSETNKEPVEEHIDSTYTVLSKEIGADSTFSYHESDFSFHAREVLFNVEKFLQAGLYREKALDLCNNLFNNMLTIAVKEDEDYRTYQVFKQLYDIYYQSEYFDQAKEAASKYVIFCLQNFGNNYYLDQAKIGYALAAQQTDPNGQYLYHTYRDILREKREKGVHDEIELLVSDLISTIDWESLHEEQRDTLFTLASGLIDQYPKEVNLSTVGLLWTAVQKYRPVDAFWLQQLQNTAYYTYNYYYSTPDIWEQPLTEAASAYMTMVLRIFSEEDPGRYYQLCQKYYLRLLSSIYSKVMEKFTDATEIEKEKLWGDSGYWLAEGGAIAYHFGKFNDPFIGDIFNAAIFSKGILLSSSIELGKAIEESRDYNLISLYKSYIAENNPRAKNDLEKKLLQQSAAFGDYMKFIRTQWQDIHQALRPGEAAVEFINFKDKDTTRYAALLLRYDADTPVMIPLFSKEQLDNIYVNDYTTYKEAAGSDKGYLKNDIYTNTLIGKTVWAPLVSHLNDIKSVYFSPAGELHQLAIEYLPVLDSSGNNYFFDLYRLSSTRQLLSRKHYNYPERKTVLYGGVAYSAGIEEMTGESERYAASHNKTDSLYNSRQRNLTDAFTQRGIIVSFLPGTKAEVDTIENIMTADGKAITKYTAGAASEESFKALPEQHPSTLHIATHGFYFNDEESIQKENQWTFLADGTTESPEARILSRSGLLMAGANNTFAGITLPDGIEDGILTAREVSRVDLRGLDLAVLSACQTGLGAVTGEGVFGLQRGFKKAGAGSIIMSLWSVDDRATQMMMTGFYKALKETRYNKQLAFRQAQEKLRNHTVSKTKKTSVPDTSRPKQFNPKKLTYEYPQKTVLTKTVEKPYDHPQYWAAFILLDGIQ